MQLAVHRRDNRKRHRRGWQQRLMCAGCALLVVASVGAVYRWSRPIMAGIVTARAFIFDNPYFSVREIQVRGGDKVGGSEIVAMAGLKHGMNMWKIDPAAIEKKVARHPWVRKVLARREFPRRVVIEVEERTPKAIVAMGKLYYVDADGVVFKEVGADENVAFPLLTGLRPEELMTADTATRKRIQDAVRVGERMAKGAHALSEIHFDAPERLVLYTTPHAVALQVGWGDWDGKLQRLDRVLAAWKGNEDRLASLDVSFRDQVVARLRRVKQ